MKALLVSLAVLGFSGNSSSPDVDLAELIDASPVGLEPFTAVHLSRSRRYIDYEAWFGSCCGNYNPAMVKEEKKYVNECMGYVTNKKYSCAKEEVTNQMYYCFMECLCKHRGLCDNAGFLKEKPYKEECPQYYAQKELNKFLGKMCEQIILRANRERKG
ncbi:uncharacterized protein [Periplaneta americana]|uniref:uncharacterized protein n=1 Tax=Periplaneta americana TaxID=6978 RepID=UPI0037E7216C